MPSKMEVFTKRINSAVYSQLVAAASYIAGTKWVTFLTKPDITNQYICTFFAALLRTDTITVYTNEARLFAVSIIVHRNGSRRKRSVLSAVSLRTPIGAGFMRWQATCLQQARRDT